MRLFELISEAINTTTLKNPLKIALHNEILDSTHQIYYKEPKLDPDTKAHANKNGTLTQVMPVTIDWLKTQLNVRLSLAIEDVIKEQLNIEPQVQFKKTHFRGIAPNGDMILSDEYIDDIAKDICNSVQESTIDNLENEHEIVETLFRCFKNTTVRDLYYRSNLEKYLNDLITTIIHELTHDVQHSQQIKQGRTRAEYRSYLEPNKEKFHAVMNKMHNQEELTPEEWNLYYSSPQEIGSFAQEAALKFIDDMQLDTITTHREFKEIKADLPKLLNSYVNKRFNDPKNHKEYAVFKRFNKLMYQQVLRHIEQEEIDFLRKSHKAPVR